MARPIFNRGTAWPRSISLQELYVDELEVLWSANDQMSRALKTIEAHATNAKLKTLLQKSPEGITKHTGILKALIELQAIVAGRFASTRGRRPLLIAGGVLYAVANACYALRLSGQPDYFGVWLPGQLMGGTAVGLLLPSLGGAAVATLGPRRLGVGSAVNNAIRQIGSVIGAAVCVAMVGASGVDLSAFTTVYWLLAGLGLVMALICLGVDTKPQSMKEVVNDQAL